jgi:hypothetical protein
MLENAASLPLSDSFMRQSEKMSLQVLPWDAAPHTNLVRYFLLAQPATLIADLATQFRLGLQG